MKLGNTAKILLGALGTILFGAIGSGFWERVLSPFLSYLSSSLTTALSSVSKTYSDSIYTSAANLFTPNSTPIERCVADGSFMGSTVRNGGVGAQQQVPADGSRSTGSVGR